VRNNYWRGHGLPEQCPGQFVSVIAVGQVCLRYGRDHVVRYWHTATVGLDYRGRTGAGHDRVGRGRRTVADPNSHRGRYGCGRVRSDRRRGRRRCGHLYGRSRRRRHRVGGRHGLRLRLELLTRSLRHSPVPNGCKNNKITIMITLPHVMIIIFNNNIGRLLRSFKP